ncbi:MAG TPA: acyltransferase [Mucilaginibacter sp.]|jgi:peptidoglycan/LPS O-acetylase OafA/YrhL|nr:acyltransferase [Mucilaginibacter sp.]
MPQAKEQSLVSIDIARAVAALGVFYYHLHLGRVLRDYTGFEWLYYAEAFGAFYAVPLFFLISGYCIHLSNIRHIRANEPLPIKKYYIRRLKRLYPPYIVALAVSVAVGYLVVPKNYNLTPANALVHIFLLQAYTERYFVAINVVLWTISVELAFYLIYPVFYYLRRRFSLDVALVTIFIVSGISIALLSIFTDYSLPRSYFPINIWFAWCCGAYLADKVKLNPAVLKKPVYKIIYAGILVAFILFQVTGLSRFDIIGYQLKILVWTAPLVLLICAEPWLSRKRNFLVKITAMIGLSSYSLYLLHEPLISLKNYCASKFLPHALQHAGIAIGIFLIPVITWFSYKYIEKPFMARKPEPVVNE